MQIPDVISSRFRFAGNVARAVEVAKVLAKYGLAAWLNNAEWLPASFVLRSHGDEVLAGQPFEARVRLAVTDLGTTFIKLGQMLSTRPELIGEALAAELCKLQQSTPPDSPDVAIRVVEAELGRPISECFEEFDGVAIASASIGQVHKARLKSGKRVVVKVQHPGIEGTIRRDLDILALLADVAERNDQLLRYQPVALIREFSRTTLKELDFNRELRNLKAFRRNFAEDETVCIPKPYPDLTTGRVLTMEHLKGVPLADADRLAKLEFDRPELAKRGANIFIEMIFRDGFYHADPHPGNLLVMADGKFGLLDAGMVGRIDEIFRKQIEDILMAAGDRDARRLADAVVALCGEPADLDRGSLSSDLDELFVEFGTQDVGQFDIAGALNSVRDILREHDMVLPGKLAMLLKCLILLQGTSRRLSPTFSLAEVLEPWRKMYIKSRFSPAARIREIRRLYGDWARLAESLPKSITRVIDRVEHGKFVIHLEHRHLKSAANRLVVGLFLSSLMIASALLIHSYIPPLVGGVSLLGLLGYLVAIIFGVHLLWTNRDALVSNRKGDWD